MTATVCAYMSVCVQGEHCFIMGILNLNQANVAIKRCCHGNDRGREREEGGGRRGWCRLNVVVRAEREDEDRRGKP